MNIGLIASLGIYSSVDEYGFLITPYRAVERGKVNGAIKQLRADEETRSTLAPPDVVDTEQKPDELPPAVPREEYLSQHRKSPSDRRASKLREGTLLARVQGDLKQVSKADIDYVDISPKQTVGVSASLIPFLEHDDANRALMGSNMQRQAVPLIRTDPPIIATGMERPVAENSGHGGSGAAKPAR